MKGYYAYPLLGVLFLYTFFPSYAQEIPLPEHPRPDFERALWKNLNGSWDFAFDATDKGVGENWFDGKQAFSQEILVPFPWGSELSGLEDEADIGWYQREIQVDPGWEGKRIFLVIGASDWETQVWLDGKHMGTHEGGYVPIEVDLTAAVDLGKPQQLVIRVDDARRDFTLYGKQGYGNARGIWQTTYLEARGQTYLDAVHIVPDIDKDEAHVTAYLSEAAEESMRLKIQVDGEGGPITQSLDIPEGQDKVQLRIPVSNPRLWSLDDPYLYDVTAILEGRDTVSTYFGMRKISVVDLPGTEYRYIALNNEPIYVQLALDQSYHPKGFYTFPSDQFMREEIQRSKDIGLNGIRVHIKVEIPRKLYWADKLGLLVMEDLPNSWGEPDEKMQKESEYTLRQMIKRDFNHPSIFSWVDFNETWGLRTEVEEEGEKVRKYLPETQYWVASMYYLTKSLDPSRLAEDNSICCGAGHTETDINSWHSYLPGWEWEAYLKNIVINTYPGSSFDFEEGFQQGNQPNINSECGNVWGYEGSTGDVDWSWDYHRMLNTFRKYPKVAGWLYTEHHDVINEWNGYWRFDRSEKETGLGSIFEGMSIRDFHSDVYLTTGNDICLTVEAGEVLLVPMFLSVMTGKDFGEALQVNYSVEHLNYIGETEKVWEGSREVEYRSWMQAKLPPLSVNVPELPGISTIKLWVSDSKGNVLHRNFMHLVVDSDKQDPKITQLSVAPSTFSDAKWSKKQWEVLNGKKVNGAGKGYFEYTISIPSELKLGGLKEAYFTAELSAKQLFVKDQAEFERNQDYMKGSRVAPSSNPNSYPMTDESRYPSKVSIKIDRGGSTLTTTLENDPADHRGVLSWHSQLQDRKLREAGSYGYLVKVPLTRRQLVQARKRGEIKVRIETLGENGLAIYGKDFGRYPLDPSIVLTYK